MVLVKYFYIKPMDNKSTPASPSNLYDISLGSFCKFCKNNIALLIAITIALFFCYGIKLFQYSIGIDTEQFLAHKTQQFEHFVQIGRFGFTFLHWLLHINEFNPFTASLSTFCLIWLFTVSWSYIIAIFQQKTEKNYALIPFALVFITSPIWAEQFYFTLQSTEVAFMVLLCPFAIYFLFKGFIYNEIGKIIFAFLSLVLMTSVYQAMAVLFCCGMFACFLLLLETSNYKPSVYRNLCLKFLVTVTAAMILYSIIDRVIIPPIFNIEKSLYFDNMNQWGQISVKESILKISLFAYILTVGTIPQIQEIASSIIANNVGMEKANAIVNDSRVFGNILLLPLAIFFIIKVANIARKKILSGNRFLYVLAGILIPLSIMFLAITGGSKPPMRAVYVLPFAFAFMFFFLMKIYSKKTFAVIAILALLTATYQAQITAQLFYSDQLRYNEDVRLAYEIQDIIIKTDSTENLPIVIIGNYDVSKKFHANFLKGEIIGYSFFEFGKDTREKTERCLDFMRSLGINFNSPSDEQLERAINEAASMPSYPNIGYIKKFPNVIVVKFSTLP